jgi:hypothetical protein
MVSPSGLASGNQTKGLRWQTAIKLNVDIKDVFRALATLTSIPSAASSTVPWGIPEFAIPAVVI